MGRVHRGGRIGHLRFLRGPQGPVRILLSLLSTSSTHHFHTLCCRSTEMGGSWVPVFDSNEERSAAGEVYWPVGVNLGLRSLTSPSLSSSFICIVCSKAQPVPVIHPRPIFTRMMLHVPIVAVEGESSHHMHMPIASILYYLCGPTDCLRIILLLLLLLSCRRQPWIDLTLGICL